MNNEMNENRSYALHLCVELGRASQLLKAALIEHGCYGEEHPVRQIIERDYDWRAATRLLKKWEVAGHPELEEYELKVLRDAAYEMHFLRFSLEAITKEVSNG